MHGLVMKANVVCFPFQQNARIHNENLHILQATRLSLWGTAAHEKKNHQGKEQGYEGMGRGAEERGQYCQTF